MTDAFSDSLGPVPAIPRLAALPPRIFVEMEWNLDPVATVGTEKWVRVTHLLKSFRIRRGRNRALDRAEAGTFSGVFDGSDRRFEEGYQGSILNLAKNPSLEGSGGAGDISGYTNLGTANLGGGSGVGSHGKNYKPIGHSPAAVLAIGDGVRIVNPDTTRFPVTGGQKYTASAHLATSVETVGNRTPVKMQILEYDAGGSLIRTSDGTAAAPPWWGSAVTTWGRRHLTVTLLAGAATVAIQIVVTATGSDNTEAIAVDGVQLEAGELTDYIDGDQDNGRWEGVAHESRTFRGGPYFPNVRPMRRLRVIAVHGNPVEDSSVETVPRTTADNPASADAWLQVEGSVTRVTTTPFVGTYCYRGEKLDADGAILESASRYRIPVEPGDQVVASCYFRKPVGGADPQCSLMVVWYDSNGSEVGSFGTPNINPPDNAWERHNTDEGGFGTATAPPTARYMGIRSRVVNLGSGGGLPAVGTVAFIDGIQIDHVSLSSYKQGQGPRTLFRGFMKRLPQAAISFRRGEVTIDAVDGMAILAADKFVGSPPSEGSTARLNRLLDDLLWPSALRVLDAGTATLAAQTDLSTPHLTHALDIALTELGVFFINGPGYAVLHDKLHRGSDPRSTVSQALFGDDPATAELPYLPTLLPVQDVAQVRNEVTATGAAAGATAQTATMDTVSRDRYWPRPESYNTLHSTDGAVLTWAQAVRDKLKEPALEIARIDVEPARDERLWQVALALEISDRITVNRRPQRTELRVYSCFVESVEHNCVIGDRKVQWTSGWSLSPAP